ncbi:hypothetical protein GN956_G2779 [Arapaima gigas]
MELDPDRQAGFQRTRPDPTPEPQDATLKGPWPVHHRYLGWKWSGCEAVPQPGHRRSEPAGSRGGPEVSHITLPHGCLLPLSCSVEGSTSDVTLWT